MADVFTKAKRSAVMSAIRSRRNKSTELVLASALRQAGIKGWRRHLRLPGRPDFAFPTLKVAVFVDGCFWHGCRKHRRLPKSNASFWKKKISGNVRRDRKVDLALRCAGWTVVRFWEHDMRLRMPACLIRIKEALACGQAET